SLASCSRPKRPPKRVANLHHLPNQPKTPFPRLHRIQHPTSSAPGPSQTSPPTDPRLAVCSPPSRAARSGPAMSAPSATPSPRPSALPVKSAAALLSTRLG
ncbi:hypothetical protein LTR04_004896, partial [Oleoguttula sp. CCFEE 6159]